MDPKDQKILALETEIAALKKILALMPGNMYWKDRSGKYLGCNQNTADLLKLNSPEDIIGKTLLELDDAKYAVPIHHYDEQLMANNKQDIQEERTCNPAGVPVIYLSHKTPLHDEQGNVIGLVGVSIDITEQKKIEEELRKLQEKNKDEEIFSLKKIITLMPDNIYWKDRRGKYLGCNDNMAAILKLNAPNEIEGKTLYDMLDKSYADAITKIDEEIMSSNKELTIEENGIDSYGNPAVYFTRKHPLRNQAGDVIGLIGISFNITERKKMEEELRMAKEKAEISNRAKTQFISVASHELRIPLSGILGMANFLHEGGLTPEEEKEYVENILDAAKYQLSIVNSILDFAKLEADKFEIASAPVNLKELLEETAAMLTAPAKNKGLALWVVYDPDVPYQILSDSRVLRQIFSNLINNAIKFTEEGHIAVRVHCLKQTASSIQLEIAVEDTGIGIPADKLDHVFERFSQIADAYVRDDSRSGTGLGLSIVKKWIEMMGGNIQVKSELGKGSTFSCTFEFLLQANATQDIPWALYSSNIRILIIDDTLRGDIICKHAGTKNCEVAAGNKALDTFFTAQQIRQPFDIIIIDGQLRSAVPETLLKTMLEKSKRKPLSILLVPDGSLKEKNTAIQQGFFATIVKPVQPIAFQTALTSLWEQWVELKQNKS
jgi:two-component system, OmpR family, aerobic respiration control sensor histidine kinase ArcB